MSDFFVIVMKEVRDLMRNKQIIVGMIIVPLILFPALGKMISFGMSEAKEETKVILVNFDEGKYGNVLISALKAAPNVTVTLIDAQTVQEAIQKAQAEGYNVVVIIPKDFSKNIEANEKTYVEVYAVFKGISAGIKESVSEGRINVVLQVLNEELAKLKISETVKGNPEAVLHPIDAKSYSVIQGRIVNVPPSVVSGIIYSQAFSIPLVLFIMISYVSQMAATTMAAEKENKTLETLLTLPVRRVTIITGKMVGTAIIALVASIAYMIGLKYYINSFTPENMTQIGITLKDLGLEMTPKGALLFGISLFLSIVFALSLAMLISVFAEDVRSASTMVSMIMMPLLFPIWILMFKDVSTLPPAVKYFLYAIPFSHPVIASRAVLLKQYGIVYAGIAYLLFISGAMLYITAKFFSTEKVLTAKLKWGKKRGAEK